MPRTDREIIGQILNGEKRQYALLVARYQDRAFSLAVRMLKNREEAEEASQDAFVRAFNALGSFQGTAAFGTWLYRIVYNVCLTRLGRRTKGLQLDEYSEESEAVNPESDDTLKLLEVDDLATHVKKGIDMLPAKYSSILAMFYLQELSYEEICEVTGLPLGTVKVQLFRARANLQKQLREELRDEGVFQ